MRLRVLFTKVEAEMLALISIDEVLEDAEVLKAFDEAKGQMREREPSAVFAEGAVIIPNAAVRALFEPQTIQGAVQPAQEGAGG